jgi:Domain of unknown function (DUF4169)
MGDVIYLRQARKQKARAAKEQSAEQNRLLSGRSKAEKLRDRQSAERSNLYLEGHRRDPSGGKDPV